VIAWARWEVVGTRVVWQKWRWTELAVTLGLALVTFRRVDLAPDGPRDGTLVASLPPPPGDMNAPARGRRQETGWWPRQPRLAPCGLPRYETVSGGASPRPLDATGHRPGQRHTPKSERPPPTVRPRLARWIRQTSGFSHPPPGCPPASWACVATAMPLDGRYTGIISTFDTLPIQPCTAD
jgi:hypothetical protein